MKKLLRKKYFSKILKFISITLSIDFFNFEYLKGVKQIFFDLFHKYKTVETYLNSYNLWFGVLIKKIVIQFVFLDNLGS